MQHPPLSSDGDVDYYSAMPRTLVSAFAFSFLVACSRAQYPVVSSCAAPTAASYTTVVSSQQYSTASTNNFLSVYKPNTGSNWPLVVWVHGGGWNNTSLFYNSAFTLNEVVTYLVGQGYAVASIDYRYTTGLNNPAIMPAQIKDVRCAMMWLKANLSGYGISTARVVVMGESAGGHLAGMLAMNIANGAGFDDTVSCASYPGDASVASAVLYYPVLDLRATANMGSAAIAGLNCSSGQDCLTKALGGTAEAFPSLAASVSPITYIASTTVPILISAGSADVDVMISPTRNFKNALLALGGQVTYVELSGVGHGFLATDTTNYWSLASPYAPSVCTTLNFISQTAAGIRP